LPNFAKNGIPVGMTTMNISLPDGMKSFVDQQVSARGYGTSSEYVRELIRKDQDIQRLRALLRVRLPARRSTPAISRICEAASAARPRDRKTCRSAGAGAHRC